LEGFVKQRGIVFLCLPFVASVSVFAAPPASKPDVQRGAYLVKIMGCNDCHTPAKMGPKGLEPDMARMLTGHPADLKMPPAPDLGKGPWVWAGAGTLTAFAGPWGVSYAINLTPDPETGIGKWTEKTFIEAVRSGRHLGKGRPILPPMPWPSLAAATDRDLRAIFAYLKSVPPAKNAVPEPVEPPGSSR
jgi:hypothetical protein